MFKPGGSWAFRWLCLRCRRRAVDAGEPVGIEAAYGRYATIEALLSRCTVRSTLHGSGVGVFIGPWLYWQLPLPLALALRDSVTGALGVHSESTNATALHAWCAWHFEQAVAHAECRDGEPHESWGTWEVSLVPQGTGGAVQFSRQGMAPLTHTLGCCRPPVTSPPSTRDDTAAGAAGAAEGLAGELAEGHQPDDALAAGVLLAATGYTMLDPTQWVRVPAPTGVTGRAHRGEGEEHLDSSPASTRMSAVHSILSWLHTASHVAPNSVPAAYNPWPRDQYVPPPVHDCTVHRACDEALASCPRAVHPAAPLLLHSPAVHGCKLNADAWEALFQGHPQQALILTTARFGQPTLVSKYRKDVWQGTRIPQPTLRAQGQREAVTGFIAKERARGRMVPVRLGVKPADEDDSCLYAPDPTLLWFAPFVVAPKQEPGQVAPAWRVCHDLSREAVAVTTPAHHSPNSDMVLTPVAPVTLATLADLLQRYRFLTEQRPGVRILIAKADFRAFFRQFGTRRADWCVYAQVWGEETLVHTVNTFGPRSAVHTCTAMANALGDVLAAKEDVHPFFFVDDAILMNYDEPNGIYRDVATFEQYTDVLGLERHPAKWLAPCRQAATLGVVLDLDAGHVTVSPGPSRRDHMVRMCDTVLSSHAARTPLQVGFLLEWAGLCVFLGDLGPWGRTYTAPIWHLVYRPHGGRGLCVETHHMRTVTSVVAACARWWAAIVQGEGPAVTPFDIGVNPERPPLLVSRARSDAATSLGTGLGGVVFTHPGYTISDTWHPHERMLHINTLELIAAVMVVCTAAPLLSGTVCVLETDNTVCLTAIRKEGSGSPLTQALALLLAAVQARYRFFLRVHYVKGEVNQGADGRSRGTIGPSSLPQDGWDWRSLPVPAPIRHLGTNESSALLPPQSPGRTLCPPQQPDIWADTLANELARASPPTWAHCAASAPLIPFVPYHPAWQPAMRDATGLPAW